MFVAAGDHVRGDDVPAVSRAAERGPAQVGREHGSLPETPLLHAGIRTPDGARQPKVSRHDGAGTDAANVRRKGGCIGGLHRRRGRGTRVVNAVLCIIAIVPRFNTLRTKPKMSQIQRNETSVLK